MNVRDKETDTSTFKKLQHYESIGLYYQRNKH